MESYLSRTVLATSGLKLESRHEELPRGAARQADPSCRAAPRDYASRQLGEQRA
jgi:hypothetical protein